MILHIVTFSQATPGALCEETHYLHQNFIVLRKTKAMTLRMRCAMAARCGATWPKVMERESTVA